jgi:hypothetical protein
VILRCDWGHARAPQSRSYVTHWPPSDRSRGEVRGDAVRWEGVHAPFMVVSLSSFFSRSGGVT